MTLLNVQRTTPALINVPSRNVKTHYTLKDVAKNITSKEAAKDNYMTGQAENFIRQVIADYPRWQFLPEADCKDRNDPDMSKWEVEEKAQSEKFTPFFESVASQMIHNLINMGSLPRSETEIITEAFRQICKESATYPGGDDSEPDYLIHFALSLYSREAALITGRIPLTLYRLYGISPDEAFLREAMINKHEKWMFT